MARSERPHQSRLSPLVGILVTSSWLLSACGDGGSAPLLAECERDEDCASGHCIDNVDRSVSPFDVGGSPEFRFCSEPCQGVCEGADGAQGVCGFSGEGDGWCVFECMGEGQAPTEELDGFVCQRGTPMACEPMAEPDCMVCGCGAGQYCELSTRRCRQQRDMMDACAAHEECLSGHCNLNTGRCELTVGESCDEGPCTDCARLDDQSYCTQACDADVFCPSGWRCVAFFMADTFHCRKECGAPDDPCPLPNEECTEVDSDSGPYMICAG